VFGKSWDMFIEISFDELEDHYKKNSSLRKELGKIVVQAFTRANVKA